jgi:hypothetical protein
MADKWTNVEAIKQAATDFNIVAARTTADAEFGFARLVRPVPGMPANGFTDRKSIALPLAPSIPFSTRTAQDTSSAFGARDELKQMVISARTLTINKDYSGYLGTDQFNVAKSVGSREDFARHVVNRAVRQSLAFIDAAVAATYTAVPSGNKVTKGTTATGTAMDPDFVADVLEKIENVGGDAGKFLVVHPKILTALRKNSDIQSAMVMGQVQLPSALVTASVPMVMGCAILRSANVALTTTLYENLGGTYSPDEREPTTFEIAFADMGEGIADAEVIRVPGIPGAVITGQWENQANAYTWRVNLAFGVAVRDPDGTLFSLRCAA